MTDKATLRAEARVRRAAVHGVVDSEPALVALASEIAGTRGRVSFYWPIRTELDPRPLMEQLFRTREVCLPVTNGLAPLVFRAWRPGTTMDIDGFGVAVPANGPEVIPAVLVVPMLAFDETGQRLGYGAGHYDRTLAQLRPAGPVTAIGLAYEAQCGPDLPAEPTDQRLDAIVTEERTRRFG